jgi:hypothetical protein
MRLFNYLIPLFLGALLFTPQAHAYRPASISSDSAEVKDSPAPDAQTVANLPRGTRVNTSDGEKGGYYRVRAANASGWVRDTDLSFGNASLPPVHRANQRPERMPERMNDEAGAEKKDKTPTSHDWFLTVFGGLDTFNPSDVNTLIGSTALNSGAGFGGELAYGLSKDWFLAFRLESIGKNVTGNSNNGAGATFNISMSSTPVMFGLDYQAAQGSDVSFDLGGFLGEGLGTKLNIAAASSSSDVTTISGSAPVFELVADLNWHITTPLWLFAEGGYRYLKTSQLTANPVGTTSGAFLSPTQSSSNVIPVDISMSGLLLNLGLRLNF